MIVDTSAVVAMLAGEASADALKTALTGTKQRYISAANAVELGIVLEGNTHALATGSGERFLRELRIEIVPVDANHTDRALEGWRRFGKGRHPAALNFGDCFTYALASTRNLPVLCTGNDFAQTDVQVVPLVEQMPNESSDD